MRKSSKPAAAPRRGRPVDPAKQAAIIRAAQEVFVAKGFEATSLEAVAAHAGVSKLTIYNHFGGKDDLFAAALNAKCDHFMDPDAIRTAGYGSTRDGLVQIGRAFLALILDREVLQMHRVVMAESVNHPRVAALFFAKAVEPTAAKVAEFLADEAAAGRLHVADPAMAAWEFLSLLKGRPMFVALLNLPLPSRSELNAHIERCVQLFLHGCAGTGTVRRSRRLAGGSQSSHAPRA
ncbi:MAG: TetR/AcrR family transcriptional regulator [Rhodospirillaceae bacterium]|nr:TetR/AcrR family transcriptional regulator [Rhodospirillaceae bacterium]